MMSDVPPLDRLSVYGGKGLWIRLAYMDDFKLGLITAVIRPGDRSDQKNERSLPIGERVPVRFIIYPGDQKHGVRPKLAPDDGTTIRVTKCTVKKISKLTKEDLVGCSPDTSTPALVQYHLALIYNTPITPRSATVTVFRFEYC